MAERFHTQWVSFLPDYADKAAKSTDKKDYKRLSVELNKEIKRMESYTRYVEKTYGTAGKEENSLELQFIKKARKQLIDVRDQVREKMKDPGAAPVEYYKVLNLAKESAAKFEAYSKSVEGTQHTPRAQEVKAHASANVDKIFVDMFENTKRTDFQALGKALASATALLSKYGYNVTDEVKARMVKNYDKLSSDTAFQIILDVQEDIKDRIEEKQNIKASEQELKDLEKALATLRGVM